MTVTEAIKSVLSTWGNSAKAINAGYCLDFVSDVSALVPSAEVWQMEGYHAWLRHGGLYYDAEAPDGVKRLKDLPIFGRYQPGRPDNFRGKRLR